MRTFLLLWMGQVVSSLGTGLSSFALGMWMFQSSGRVTEFGVFTVATMLPGLLVVPLAGVLVDRCSRKRVMVVADLAAACAVVTMFVLLGASLLTPGVVVVLCMVVSMSETFVFLALSTSMTVILPARHWGRGSGLLHGGQGLTEIVAPALAGAALARWGIAPVLAADALSFALAALVTALVVIPALLPADAPAPERSRLGTDILFGLRYVLARPGLLWLLLYFAMINFGTGFAVVLVTPLVLAQGTVDELGWVMSIAGAGALAGSVLTAAWGGPARKVRSILVGGVVFGALGWVAGLRSTPDVLAGCAFVMMFIYPVLTSMSSVVWQSKVPAHVQGRVFAFRAFVANASVPIAYLLAGPLADRLFEPGMAEGGALVGVFGDLFGTGPGRGMGVMLAVFGLVPVAGSIAGALSTRLRRLEAELPDVIVEEA